MPDRDEPAPFAAPGPTPPPPPAAPIAPQPIQAPWPAPARPRDRFVAAHRARRETDYEFEFWSALGWTVLSCGYYAIYVLYQQVRRSRDHIRRRGDLLEAAALVAWEHAEREGTTELVRPNFDRMTPHFEQLRALDRQFRDPGVWAVLGFVGGFIAHLVALALLDRDLIAHDRAEGAIEHELVQVYAAFGITLTEPDPTRVKAPHNIGGRVAATIGSCGIYAFWWVYDSMNDLNQHFAHNWRAEDELAAAINRLEG